MENLELYKKQEESLDMLINDIINGTDSLKNPGDVIYYNFFIGNDVRGEIIDLVPNVNISCIHNTLEIIWKNYSGIHGSSICSSVGSLDSEKCLCNLKYIKNLISNKIKMIESSFKEINKKSFISDLLEIARIMQGNKAYYDCEENIRNDYVRDLLEFKGYVTKDQSRHGDSFSGKKSGQVDLIICENKVESKIIVEGENLKSCECSSIIEHIKRIFKYDKDFNDYNVLLSYVNVKNFHDFLLNYKKLLEEWHDESKPIEVRLVNDYKSSVICILESVHTRNAKNISIYHILIHFIDN